MYHVFEIYFEVFSILHFQPKFKCISPKYFRYYFQKYIVFRISTQLKSIFYNTVVVFHV